MNDPKLTTGRDNSINNGASTSCINSGDDNNWSELCDESVLQELLDEPFEEMMNHSSLRSDEKYHGFDNNAGSTWIYPKNYPMRNYQYNITKMALFRNTLVVLPTGLGKTFIAAVVMYNIYRWYPTGKVIFMAPTKPLVSQQIEACRKIMGIPIKDTAEITGKQNKKLRQELWQLKRVFFVTPHVVQNDINDNEQNFPFNDVRLIVVDEAHKARGRYAHCEAVQAIASRNPNFRILALSATPGRRVEDVIEVIKNLFISHLEVRWENSLDVFPYTHKKSIKTVVVPLDSDLIQIRNDFIDIIDPYIRYLIENQVMSGSVSSISRGGIIMEQKRFREMSMLQKHPNETQVKTNFSICVSLYHALELLERHGARVFLNFFDDPSHETAQRYYVATNSKLRQFLGKLRQYVGPDPFLFNDQTMTNGKVPEIPQDLDFGHPKFLMVRNSLIEHFEKTEDSRVIVFCEYRESVMLVYRALLQSRPLIKPRVFVGQGGTGSIRAVTQKQQLEVMEHFRAGICNTLVATSVAEEGIDVGEVDLIICFDISTRDPTRFTQRIGRTGRRRQGNIIMMVTEGKEQAMMKEVLQSKDKLNQKVVKSRDVARMLFKSSPRIVPPEFNPKCMEMFMIVNENVEEKKPSKAKKVKETKPKVKATKKTKAIALSQKNSDVRNFFKKVEMNKEDQEIFCTPRLETSTRLYSEPEQVDSVPNDLEKILEKIKKFRTEPITPEGGDCEKDYIGKMLRGSSIATPIKRFILTSNVSYVKEKYEAMKALEAVGDNSDVHILDVGEVHLKIEFNAIEQVLGKGKIEEFLAENHTKDVFAEAEDKFGAIFQGLEQRPFEDCVQPFLKERIAGMDFEDEYNLDESDAGDSIVYKDIDVQSEVSDEPHNSNDDMELEHESRYMSQLTQFDRNKISDQSTPLHVVSRLEMPMENMIGKELFPIEEFDDEDPFGVVKALKNENEPCSKALIEEFNDEDPFGMVEALEKENEPCSKALAEEFNNEDPFGVGEALKKENEPCPKETTDTETAVNKVPSHKEDSDLFDDDFDDLLITQVERVANKASVCSESEGYSVEEILRIVEEKQRAEKQENTTTLEEKSALDCTIAVQTKSTHQDAAVAATSRLDWNAKTSLDIENKGIARAGVKDFDYTGFFEPFDCDDIEVCGVSHKTKTKKCNKSVNMFENTIANENSSPKTPSNIPRQISAELFGSCDQSSNVLKSAESQLSPTENNVKVAAIKEFKSPSVLHKKPNLGRLRLACSDSSAAAMKTTAPSRRLFEAIVPPAIENDAKQVAVTTKIDTIHQPKATGTFSETESPLATFFFQRRNKRVIVSSDEEELIIPYSQVENNSTLVNKRPAKRRRVRRKFCQFIDDEAIVSGDDDELGNEEQSERSEFQLDSIVVCDDDAEDHPDVDMQAKYLQSVRSPIKGAFKIPAPRTFNDMSHIFSQPVPYDISVYKENSFVVISDDEDEPENNPSQECPLERAEAILKARRRAKRRRRLDNYLNLDGYEFDPIEEDNEEGYNRIKMRRRNIHKIRDSSQDDDFEEAT